MTALTLLSVPLFLWKGRCDYLSITLRCDCPSADAPRCRPPRQQVTVSAGSNVTVECTVDAHPPPSRYTWSLNSSQGMHLLHRTQVSAPASRLSGQCTCSNIHRSVHLLHHTQAVHLMHHTQGQCTSHLLNSIGQCTLCTIPRTVHFIPAAPCPSQRTCSTIPGSVHQLHHTQVSAHAAPYPRQCNCCSAPWRIPKLVITRVFFTHS